MARPIKQINLPDNPKKTPYDWGRIETDYISDPTQTYRSLSQRYGPLPKAICRHAKAGGWQEKRAAFQTEKKHKAQELLAHRKAKESVEDITKMNKAHYESQAGLKYLADMKMIADINKVKGGGIGELSIKDIQALANANRTIQESQRVARGIDDQRLNMNLVVQHLNPILDRIVNVIITHAPAEVTRLIVSELEKIVEE